MVLLLKVSIVFILVHCIRTQTFDVSPQYCLSDDLNDDVCSAIENFFGFGPFQQFVEFLAGSLTAFTNIFQIQEVALYVTQSFGQNPLNTTDYESMSKSFNLIIFQPNSMEEPRNISSTYVLKSCDVLKLNGRQLKLIWPGYGDNCNGSNPQAIFDWTPPEMQRYADVSNSTIIEVDWGFAGLSCYGYIQITLCLVGKIADFFAHLLNNCAVVEEMELIGHSIGAQMIGYIAQRLKSRGRQVKTAIGLDPAGPGYENIGLRCQGIQTGCAEYSMVLHSNPCQLGTCDFTFGDVKVLLNPTHTYCQPGCTCFLNPGCSHSYVLQIFLELTQNIPLFATYTAFNPALPGLGEPAIVTIYQEMKPGYYVLNTYS